MGLAAELMGLWVYRVPEMHRNFLALNSVGMLERLRWRLLKVVEEVRGGWWMLWWRL